MCFVAQRSHQNIECALDSRVAASGPAFPNWPSVLALFDWVLGKKIDWHACRSRQLNLSI